jgi:hypothetical protein
VSSLFSKSSEYSHSERSFGISSNDISYSKYHEASDEIVESDLENTVALETSSRFNLTYEFVASNEFSFSNTFTPMVMNGRKTLYVQEPWLGYVAGIAVLLLACIVGFARMWYKESLFIRNRMFDRKRNEEGHDASVLSQGDSSRSGSYESEKEAIVIGESKDLMPNDDLESEIECDQDKVPPGLQEVKAVDPLGRKEKEVSEDTERKAPGQKPQSTLPTAKLNHGILRPNPVQSGIHRRKPVKAFFVRPKGTCLKQIFNLRGGKNLLCRSPNSKSSIL